MCSHDLYVILGGRRAASPRLHAQPPSLDMTRSGALRRQDARDRPVLIRSNLRLARNLYWIGGVLLLVGVLGLSGCFLPAPIEEEPPFEDEPPSFDLESLEPGRFELVSFDLSEARVEIFAITELLDVNPDQDLFWRAVIDLDGQSRVLEDLTVPPSARRVRFELNPCRNPLLSSFLVSRLNQTQEDLTYNFYIGVSDQPFVLFNETNNTIERLLRAQSDPDRPVPFAQWTLRFTVTEGAQPCAF